MSIGGPKAHITLGTTGAYLHQPDKPQPGGLYQGTALSRAADEPKQPRLPSEGRPVPCLADPQGRVFLKAHRIPYEERYIKE